MVIDGFDKINPSLYLKLNEDLSAHKKNLLICDWYDKVVSIDRYILPIYRALQENKASEVKIKAILVNHWFFKTRN